MGIAIEHHRFKQIREELKLTQSAFGKRLGLNASTADIEYGKTRITGKVVMILLRDFSINPLWLFGESEKKQLNPYRTNVIPKAITLNTEGHENILLVKAKAAAGYGQNIGDSEYMAQLPVFDFPLPEFRNASFRGFQIVGDSMAPLVKSNDWVLAKAIHDFDDVKDNKVYIIVQSDSIRLKEVCRTKDGKHLDLISWNTEYPTATIASESILEMWEYHSKISFGIERIKDSMIQKVYSEVVQIKEQIKKL